MEAATRRLRGLLDHLRAHCALRPSPLYLVAHSVGGIPAITYCRDAEPGEVAGLVLAEVPVTRFGAFITAHAEAARLSGRFGEWYKEFKEQVIFRDYLGRFPFCRHYYASLRFCRERSFLETVTAVRRLARALPGKWSHAAGEALIGLALPVIYAHVFFFRQVRSGLADFFGEKTSQVFLPAAFRARMLSSSTSREKPMAK